MDFIDVKINGWFETLTLSSYNEIILISPCSLICLSMDFFFIMTVV